MCTPLPKGNSLWSYLVVSHFRVVVSRGRGYEERVDGAARRLRPPAGRGAAAEGGPLRAAVAVAARRRADRGQLGTSYGSAYSVASPSPLASSSARGDESFRLSRRSIDSPRRAFSARRPPGWRDPVRRRCRDNWLCISFILKSGLASAIPVHMLRLGLNPFCARTQIFRLAVCKTLAQAKADFGSADCRA